MWARFLVTIILTRHSITGEVPPPWIAIRSRLYASYADHGWYANGLASYSRNAYTEQRQIEIGDFQEVANGSPSGDQETVNADGGYDFHHQGWTFGPTVGFQYVHWSMDSFTESGGCSTDLAVNEQSADSFRSRIGAHVSYAVTDAGVTYTPFLTASWQHEFLDDSRRIDGAFAEVNPITFTVNTNNPSRDSCLFGTGLNMDLNKMITLFVAYNLQVGQDVVFRPASSGRGKGSVLAEHIFLYRERSTFLSLMDPFALQKSR